MAKSVGIQAMSDVTQILSQIESGDPKAAEQLLPLVYNELRKLAAAKLAQEKPGQTLQATALVHEAYIRLVGTDRAQHWNSRGHFFGAAAEAMRRILVEHARRKIKIRHGRDCERVELKDQAGSSGLAPETILAVDDAVTRLAKDDPVAANVVKLHFFAGMTLNETADTLTVSRATAYRQWAYAVRRACRSVTFEARQFSAAGGCHPSGHGRSGGRWSASEDRQTRGERRKRGSPRRSALAKAWNGADGSRPGGTADNAARVWPSAARAGSSQRPASEDRPTRGERRKRGSPRRSASAKVWNGADGSRPGGIAEGSPWLADQRP